MTTITKLLSIDEVEYWCVATDKNSPFKAMAIQLADTMRENERLREACQFVVERENFAFAECCVAEEIWDKCKEALQSSKHRLEEK